MTDSYFSVLSFFLLTRLFTYTPPRITIAVLRSVCSKRGKIWIFFSFEKMLTSFMEIWFSRRVLLHKFGYKIHVVKFWRTDMNHEYIKEQKTANVFSFMLDANDLKFKYSKKNKKIFPLLSTFLSYVQTKWKTFLTLWPSKNIWTFWI